MESRTRYITTVGMFCAIAFAMVTVGRIPVVQFLSYDPKDIAIVIAGFILGPVAAIVISFVVSLIEMMTISDTGFIGFVMNFFSSAVFAGSASIIYHKNKSLKNALGDLLLQSLIPVIIDRMNISPETRVNEIKKEHRHRLVNILKDFEFTITGMRGFDEAVVTKGGVSVKEVEPSSMESKLIKSLYFAGEVLDLDALTGGYNLQIAWSTGWMAGSCAAGSLL